MTPSRELLILDTNVLLHVIRGNEVAQRIDEQFNLRHRQDRPLISVVTIGEGLALAKQFGWGDAKCAELEEIFRELVVVDIGSRKCARGFCGVSGSDEETRKDAVTQRSLDRGDCGCDRRASRDDGS